jgi:hypothetical protein
MALTFQLAFRIALVWAAGILLAVAVRALLPGEAGLTFTSVKTTLFVPYNRIGYFACLLASLTGTGLVVLRAMQLEFGWRPLR